jgi:hypothetical protein
MAPVPPMVIVEPVAPPPEAGDDEPPAAAAALAPLPPPDELEPHAVVTASAETKVAMHRACFLPRYRMRHS